MPLSLDTAFFCKTQNAATQIITDNSDPAAVASPMGNSVSGNIREVR